MKLHEGGQVCKSQVIRARSHPCDCAARAVARVHGHIQFFFLVVTLGLRHQEQGRRTFESPIELKLQRCVLCHGHFTTQAQRQNKTAFNLANRKFVHLVLQ